MSTLAKSVPGLSIGMWLIAVSTVMYDRLQRFSRCHQYGVKGLLSISTYASAY